VPEGKTFFSPSWAKILESDRTAEAACAYAQELGWPVMVKPNSRSQGKGVAKASTREELLQAIAAIELYESVYLVQRVVPGRDYRIVVLDGEVISAYERKPLSIVGDGVLSVQKLLEEKQQQFIKTQRDTVIPVGDFRIDNMLLHLGLTQESVIEKGKLVELLPNANLSSGGDAFDVTPLLHTGWHELAAKIARDMNLRYIGIDILTPDSLAEAPREYVVLEINSAPGLDNYAAMGEEQLDRVEAMYKKVVEAMLK
jgi:D-alanine-D-alanine ligase-like ATP-grasp enzyme